MRFGSVPTSWPGNYGSGEVWRPSGSTLQLTNLNGLLIPLLIVLVVVPIVYSYVIYQKVGDKR